MIQAERNFFSEITSSVSHMRFSRDGRYILTRDYMSLKLWDVNMESQPVASYAVHENLRGRVSPSGSSLSSFPCMLSGMMRILRCGLNHMLTPITAA